MKITTINIVRFNDTEHIKHIDIWGDRNAIKKKGETVFKLQRFTIENTARVESTIKCGTSNKRGNGK
jgi:hypothetical protein